MYKNGGKLTIQVILIIIPKMKRNQHLIVKITYYMKMISTYESEKEYDIVKKKSRTEILLN